MDVGRVLNLNDLVFFVSAVEHGGFAAASRRLGLPKSTISKRVAVLEEQLSARLIHRTSRSFTLTELGRDFYEHARGALIEAEAAEAIVRDRQAEPSGTVRISASVPVAQLQLAACLPRLARLHPKLRLQLDVSDRFVDLPQEGVTSPSAVISRRFPIRAWCSVVCRKRRSCWWRRPRMCHRVRRCDRPTISRSTMACCRAPC